MRFLIEAHHPAHIHFWKYAIRELQQRGHEVLLLSRDRDVMLEIAKECPWLSIEVGSSLKGSNTFPLKEFLLRQWRMLIAILKFKPHAVGSISGSYTQLAALLRVANIVFSDSEFQNFNHAISHPFATRIYTPKCYYKDLGDRTKWRMYSGYHELAFLNKARFSPDFSGLERVLEAKAQAYAIIRLSAWNTMHDLGERGIADWIPKIVKALEERSITPIIVAEEGKVSEELRTYCKKLEPVRFHDAIAFSRLVITEGASTASEAACLGKFTIYANSSRRGYLDDIEERYGLVSNVRTGEDAYDKLIYYLENEKSVSELASMAKELHDSHLDVTSFLARTMEHEAASGDSL